MLSIGKLAAGQEAYYLGKVANGIEDYYVGGGEAEGRWTGSGAATLGLHGTVSSEQLQAMLAAQNPASGQPLQDREQTMNGPGFDLTFSAPKSVSLLWAFGDDRVRSQVVAAHEAAVDQALGHLERHAILARRGAGGGTFLPAPNMIGAAYRHRTSRAGDPQIHTHVLVSKLVQATDGRWTCLHSPSLYANAKTAGFLYQAGLRDQLTRTLGIRWGEVQRGSASIEGIEEPAEAVFSRRRSEIEAAQADSGTGTRASWQSSALETRKAKDTDLQPGELESDWIERGAAVGLTPQTIRQRAGPGREAPPIPADPSVLTRAVTEHASHFERRDVIQALCELAPDGAPVIEIEAAADRYLEAETVVRIGELPWGQIHTTREILELERGFLDATADGQDAGRGLVTPSRTDAILAARELDEASEERQPDPQLRAVIAQQRKMVRAVTGEGHAVTPIAGVAGAGKTYALAAAHEAWRADGYPVLGACASWQAADVLAATTGIPTKSIASRIAEWDEMASRGHLALPKATILVVDEAATVDTRDLTRLHEHVEQAEGKLVLIGDYDQLQAIGAGGLFRATYERYPVAAMPHSHRQAHEVDRRILNLISTGHGTEALDLLRATNGVVVAQSGAERDQALVADWWGSFSSGDDAVMLAQTNSSVGELNALARALMANQDRLGSETVHAGDAAFATGDLVVTRINDHRQGIRNLQRWQVVDVDQEARELRLRSIEDAHEVTIGAVYLDARTRHDRPALQHGYAVTGHTAQGTTRATVFAQAEAGIYRQWATTALSRARQEMRLYAVVGEEPIDLETGPAHERSAWDDLTAAVSRDASETAAVDERLRSELSRLSDSSLTHRLHTLDRANQQAAADQATRDRLIQRLTSAQGEFSDTQTETEQAPAALRQQLAERQAAALDRLAEAQADLDEFRGVNSPSGRADQRAERILIERELQTRRQAQVTADRTNPPEYVTEIIGPAPPDPLARAAWIEAVDRIERYRQLHSVTSETDALGHQPRDPRLKAEWRQLNDRLAKYETQISQLAKAAPVKEPIHAKSPDSPLPQALKTAETTALSISQPG